jgi:predicted metal-dependent HD superfamily phosphohydrolase
MDGWRALWAQLGAADADEPLFHRLVACWSEPHRHYHTLQHLRECLAQFDVVRPLAQRPAEVELALWFHDAFYDVHRHDNEARSADWAAAEVRAAGLPDAVAQRVRALVLATEHKQPPEDPDAKLLVDIDLSILGAPRQRFDQ